ncbi:MAG TPA: hypothetical protein VFX59_27565 [Polyangiales bacterium]|nr:hypothetical protein [Polyangiales bacterium]
MGCKVWLLAALSVTASAHAQLRDAGVRRADAGSPTAAELSSRERSYMSELSLVVDGARRLISFCEQHAEEKELARFARPLAERYLELANHMLPSAKLAVAHPHLLLVVENLDRALDSAAAGDATTHQKRLRIVRDELANLEAVLKQLKLRVQEPPR